MKFGVPMLALATSALANRVDKRGGYNESYDDSYDHGGEVTYTTFTTVTTCPVTSTYTEKGTTYCITDLTTSTITVTSCDGCNKGAVATVPGPVVTNDVTTEVEVTYTTVCPVTETITGEGKTDYKTYTTTSTYVTHIPTTIYKSVEGPEITKIAQDVEYETVTSLCPVTETTTLEGKEVTITYTTTSVYVTHVNTVDYETKYKPGQTHTDVETDYYTITSLCPVTETKTVNGKEVYETYTVTSTIVTHEAVTDYATKSLPGTTQIDYETDYYTITSLCPVTETKTINGEEVYETYTVTSTIVTHEAVTDYATKSLPGTTDIDYETDYYTITSLCPVTETKTINGEEVYETYTVTSTIVTHEAVTDYATKSLPGTTQVDYETDYYTITSLCPVTETKTINGEEVYETYTVTSTIVTHEAVTDYKTKSLPGNTRTDVETDYYTITSVCPVTQTRTVSGQEVVETFTTTKTIVTHAAVTDYETESLPGNTRTAVETDYSTITSVCPVTQTKTVSGQEVVETFTTTKTIVTHGQVTEYATESIPGKTDIDYKTDYETITSLCPVTETKTINGEVVTEVYTTTKTYVTHGAYTEYATESIPGTTDVEYKTNYETITSLCPVTETKTINGEVITEVYTTTSTIVSQGVYTEYATKSNPGKTEVNYRTDYETITSLCPVTETKTINGEVVTQVYTTTSTIVSQGVYTEYATKSNPGKTEVDYRTDYETITSLCPVTETKTINGEVVTQVYTTTSTIISKGVYTEYATKSNPGKTEVDYRTDYETITSLCPVTETKTINGEEVTEVYTKTSVIVTQVPTVYYKTVSNPGETETEVQYHYATETELVPVTEVKTVNGEEVTEVHTETSVVVTQVPTVIYKTVSNPGETETEVKFQYATETDFVPVTKVKTVNGEAVTEVHTSYTTVVTEIPTTIEAITTVYKTLQNQEVHTEYSKVYVTVGGGTVYQTVTGAPQIVVQPETSVVSIPEVTITTSQVAAPVPTAPAAVPVAAAQVYQVPGIAFIAGVIGAMALI